jgi:serine phosphatase RsbU (regulator of sigma subunit)
LDSIEVVRQFTIAEGLPKGVYEEYLLNSGEIVFGTSRGVYRYNKEKDIFEPHPDFTMITGLVEPFIQMPNGDIWYEQLLSNGDRVRGVLKYLNGQYVKEKTPLDKFNDLGSVEGLKSVFMTPDSIIYFGTLSGLLRWDTKIKDESFITSFNTLIRKVYSKNSLLFGGFIYQTEDYRDIKGQNLSFLQNDLQFKYVATFYDNPEKTTYSYRLIGYDTAWSDWKTDTKKEYTNLREGSYRFEVKSKNVYQTIGYTASYSFAILPPWYRAWWAYVIYCILSITLIWIIVRLNIRRLVKQKEHLEEIVRLRTAEVVKQKEEIKTTLEIVNSQKQQIEVAHDEIKASINYARSIQSAVLPKMEQIESLLGEIFILYRPADIVSGDFYWISERSSKIVIAVADCTGHGVPGAFMSMLGITLLDEIVNKEQAINPGLILNRLRTEVVLSLKQKGELKDQKDGMDIALCTIDKENMKLQFSGAINPLYLVHASENIDERQNQNESANSEILIEIKGDPMPIGISDSMDNFTFHEIDIQKGDTFYLFTDGFPDQFGGPNHKKFSYKQFKEQIIRTRTKKIADQKLLLENVLYAWMGNNKQTDDLLVIGFKIN